MRLYLSILTVLNLLFNSGYSEEVGLTGHLRGLPKNLNYSVAVFGDGKYLNSSKMGRKDEFTLDFSDNRQKSFDFYFRPVKGDTLLLASIRAFESDEPEIDFNLPALLKNNSLINCPKCKSKDKIYKLIYSKDVSQEFTPASFKYYCAWDKNRF
jgi:hypothetical protein